MVDTRSRLVAERPEHDTAVVLVALEESLRPVDISIAPLGSGREMRPARPVPFTLPVVAHAVGLDIGFVGQHYAVFIAQREEARIVGIMRRADHIAVGTLYEHNILNHIVERDGVTRDGV